jgi:glutamate formiminotransferase
MMAGTSGGHGTRGISTLTFGVTFEQICHNLQNEKVWGPRTFGVTFGVTSGVTFGGGRIFGVTFGVNSSTYSNARGFIFANYR